jgi:hypothetical protein
MAELSNAESRYFRTIEDEFIRLRGSPFLLSAADWRLAQGWYEEGVPIEVVVGALREVFERRAERSEAGIVQSLRYCAAAVNEAWRARRELGVGQEAVEDYKMDVADRLERLADRLPPTLPRRDAWVERIRAAGTHAPTAEKALVELDRELIDGHLATLDALAHAELTAAVDASVERLGPKLADELATEDRARLLRDNARRLAGLPLLSLFSPDAR